MTVTEKDWEMQEMMDEMREEVKGLKLEVTTLQSEFEWLIKRIKLDLDDRLAAVIESCAPGRQVLDRRLKAWE